MQPEVTAIVVSWNVRAELTRCLENIRESRGVMVHTIVVDNASRDGSVALVQREFPEVTIIANRTNRGFAAAVNQGIAAARGDVLLLNPDARVEPNTIVSLEETLSSNPRIGIVGPRLSYPDGSLQPSVRRFPRWVDLLLTLSKLPNFFPRLAQRYVHLDFDYNHEQTVDQVMGSCMLIRRSTLDDVGAFDEGFWMWYEEVDFCKRARDKGWKTMYIPSAHALHSKAASFQQIKPLRKQFILINSIMHYASKHFGVIAEFLLAPVALLSLVLAALQQLLRVHKPIRARNL